MLRNITNGIAVSCRIVLRRLRALWTNPSYSSTLTGRWTLPLLRILVIVSSVALMLPGAWGHSVTVVEFAHLPAGLDAYQRHSLGLYRVCAPLSKLLYALPAHLMGIRISYPESFDDDVDSRQEWELGRIFQSQRPEMYHDIYRWSRLLPILLTVLGGCLVCEWSTSLFGVWPGIISLCAWCWLPPVLGHGSLVTSDMPSAVILLLSARTFWSFLLCPCPATAIRAGMALGLAEATKFSLLVLSPCWIMLLFFRTLKPPNATKDGHTDRSSTRLRLAVLGLVVMLVSIVAIDSLYAFQDVGFTLSECRFGRSSLAGDLKRLGESEATAWLFRVPLPIPLELFRGIDSQLTDTERLQSAYLLGRTKLGGWWYWYGAAFLLKIPVPALILFGLAIARLPAACRGRVPVFWASLCVLLPALEVALTISATTGTGTNAAFRYLLPSLGLLCVVAGCPWTSLSRSLRIVMIGFLAWLLLDVAAAVPDHVGSQNEVAWAWSYLTGRPALIGDSLDWGQDLARLDQWVSRHKRGGITLVCVYGLGIGEPYNLKPPDVLPNQEFGPPAAYLAVSEEILYGNRPTNAVWIASAFPTLSPDVTKKLQSIEPFERVGRTIRIYLLRDLTRLSAQ
jgi:hypothetical protein